MGRARPFGRIFQRGRYWYVRVRAGGQEFLRSAGPKRSYALRMLRRLREDYFSRRADARQQIRKPITLRRWWPKLVRHLRAKGYSEGTVRTEVARLKKAAASLRDPMHILGAGDVARFLADLSSEGAKPGTLVRYHTTLSVAWAEAMRQGHAEVNPLRDVPRAKVSVKAPPPIDAETFRKILDGIPEEGRAMAFFIAGTGCRRGEAYAVEPGAVNMAEETITLLRTKNRRSRVLVMLASVRELLAPRVASGGPLFPEAPSPDTLYRWFRRAAKAAGRPDIHRLHDLRAAFLTAADEAGVPLRVIRDLAGHGSVSVTNRYLAAASLEEKRAAARRMDGRGIASGI